MRQCRVMVLENMVDADSVDDELEEEVADECSKFGHVTRVTVSCQRHDDASYEVPSDPVDDVKIFVEFSLQSGNQTDTQVGYTLTLSPPIPLRLYTLLYWSNPPFLIFDIRTLWCSGVSARAPECQKLKIVG